MQKKIFVGLIALFMLAQAVFAKPAPKRIVFPRGATKVRVTGRLNGLKDEARFVLKAKKGQRMEINGDGRSAVRIFVDFPNGEGDGAPGGVEIESLPADGDYLIRVKESSMGEAWKGSFTLKITVK